MQKKCKLDITAVLVAITKDINTALTCDSRVVGHFVKARSLVMKNKNEGGGRFSLLRSGTTNVSTSTKGIAGDREAYDHVAQISATKGRRCYFFRTISRAAREFQVQA